LAESNPQSQQPRRRWFPIRGKIGLLASVLLSFASVLIVFGAWWFVTRGEIAEERIVGPLSLPSPTETFAAFENLWFEQELTRNTLTTLRRVVLGFSLAAVVGIPLGILAGSFPPIKAMLAPVIIDQQRRPTIPRHGLHTWQQSLASDHQSTCPAGDAQFI